MRTGTAAAALCFCCPRKYQPSNPLAITISSRMRSALADSEAQRVLSIDRGRNLDPSARNTRAMLVRSAALSSTMRMIVHDVFTTMGI